jgi:putative ABC transport system ATP-binding protein
VLALLRRYHEAGQTIVLVTHAPDVAAIASRIVTMRDGEVVDDHPVRPLLVPAGMDG